MKSGVIKTFIDRIKAFIGFCFSIFTKKVRNRRKIMFKKTGTIFKLTPFYRATHRTVKRTAQTGTHGQPFSQPRKARTWKNR